MSPTARKKLPIGPLLLALECTERLKYVDPHPGKQNFDAVMLSLLRPSPALSSLPSSSESDLGEDDNQWDAEDHYYPHGSLPTFSPSLRTLRLRNIALKWPRPASGWSSLACLRIRHESSAREGNSTCRVLSAFCRSFHG